MTSKATTTSKVAKVSTLKLKNFTIVLNFEHYINLNFEVKLEAVEAAYLIVFPVLLDPPLG